MADPTPSEVRDSYRRYNPDTTLPEVDDDESGEETTGGGSRWCIESVCRYLGIEESNNVKCDFRGSLYGTQETINSTRPNDFIPNNQAIGLSRRVYDTIGSNETRIDQILNNPATPADQFTRSGILNGVYAVLKASNNQSQETQQILSKLSQEGITGRFESAILGQVNQLRNYAQKFSTQNFA